MTSPDSSASLTKTAAALGHLLRRTRRPIVELGQILYLAEKAHLHRWGRLITGATYLASPNGPCLHVWPDSASISSVPSDELSVSDLTALDEALANVTGLSADKLSARTKDAAWRHCRKGVPDDKFVLLPVEAMAHGSPRQADLIAHLKDPHPG